MERYERQTIFRPLSAGGQERFAQGRVAIVGLGAVGGTAALLLGRAGVGFLRLIDHDKVSLDNLHRQLLYSEADAAAKRPKAEAAAAQISLFNHEVSVEAALKSFGPENGPGLIRDVDLVIDGLDNQADRFVLNRACHSLGLTWVQAGCTASRANVMVIQPGQTPCFACLYPDEEGAEQEAPTLHQGVIGPAAAVAGSLAAAEAMKFLVGDYNALAPGLLELDLWPHRWRLIELSQARRPDCPVCGGE